MKAEKSRGLGHINIRIRPHAHDTLRAVAAAKGISLMDLIDELAEPFDELLEPVRRNGRARKPSRKTDARESEAETPLTSFPSGAIHD